MIMFSRLLQKVMSHVYGSEPRALHKSLSPFSLIISLILKANVFAALNLDDRKWCPLLFSILVYHPLSCLSLPSLSSCADKLSFFK